MIHILLSRLRQGYRTLSYPKKLPALPERLRGLPQIKVGACAKSCRACVEACPTGAIAVRGGPPGHSVLCVPPGPPASGVGGAAPEAIQQGAKGPIFDLGRCLFCTECMEACPEGAIRFTKDHRLSTRERDHLVLAPEAELRLAEKLNAEMMRIFGRSLKLRVVSAGGCNGCEVDVNVLGTLAWDLGRFGIQVVAAPRHADAVLVCGPVTKNMELALRKTYDAVPEPKLVIAVGACAISGGPYYQQEEQLGGASSVLPVDLFIPGCPPHPLTILDGLLRLLGRLKE